MTKILFVCLGNICRSPLAQGVMENLIRVHLLEGKISCDSAGTGGWHVGELADPRSRAVAARHGFTLTHRTRTLRPSDFHDFDLILAMDHEILRETLRRAPDPESAGRVRLFRDLDPEGPGEVEDPYYGTERDFEETWRVCDRVCQNIVKISLDELPSSVDNGCSP